MKLHIVLSVVIEYLEIQKKRLNHFSAVLVKELKELLVKKGLKNIKTALTNFKRILITNTTDLEVMLHRMSFRLI